MPKLWLREDVYKDLKEMARKYGRSIGDQATVLTVAYAERQLEELRAKRKN